MEKEKIIVESCRLLFMGKLNESKQLIGSEYPFNAVVYKKRAYSVHKMLDIFYRDHFTDRYSGRKLINPGVLRILSEEMPDEMPYQAHAKMDSCHRAYWELMPSIDHILPITRDGDNEDENLVTTSMLWNLSKNAFTVDELKWKLLPISAEAWDGMTGWLVDYVNQKTGSFINSLY